MQVIEYPLKAFTPYSVTSYKHIVYKNVLYKRRIRISGFNAIQIDKILGTHIFVQNTRFVVLDLEDIKKVCKILDIEYKPVNSYLYIDQTMCSFNLTPTTQKP